MAVISDALRWHKTTINLGVANRNHQPCANFEQLDKDFEVLSHCNIIWISGLQKMRKR